MKAVRGVVDVPVHAPGGGIVIPEQPFKHPAPIKKVQYEPLIKYINKKASLRPKIPQ